MSKNEKQLETHNVDFILGFVCDDIPFSISAKSFIQCRQSIFRPEGKGRNLVTKNMIICGIVKI